MENKINIAELLKDYPKGMELDCTMYDDVKLKYVSVYKDEDYPICIELKSGSSTKLTKYGQYSNIDAAKCVIFPKGKTTWEGFVPPCKFKNGDIVASVNGVCIGITTGGEIGKFMPTYCVIQCDGRFEAYLDTKETWQFYRLATEEEKKKLFDAIRENGYKWNNETKTLEKLIVPKFKVGDKIKYRHGEIIYRIVKITEDTYVFDNLQSIPISIEYMYNLVPNKFDISTLVPFESKVLVRNRDTDIWRPAIFGGYIDERNQYKYMVIGGLSYECLIPYEGNEHLRGKDTDCDEHYKTWEE